VDTHSNLALGSLPFSTGIGPITSSVAIDKSLHNCGLHVPRFCTWSLRGIIRENDCAVCQGLKRRLPKQKTPQKTSFTKDFHSAVQIFLPELPKRDSKLVRRWWIWRCRSTSDLMRSSMTHIRVRSIKGSYSFWWKAKQTHTSCLSTGIARIQVESHRNNMFWTVGDP
jgi:hypothetical protein